MAVSHVYSNTNADATGTLTIWNGATTSTVAASNLVKPSDWNSAHNQLMTITGNTLGSSTLSGTNIVFGGTNGITVSASSAAGAATLWINGGANTVSYFPSPIPYDLATSSMASGATTTTAGGSVTSASFYVGPLDVGDNVVYNKALLYVSGGTAAGTGSWSAGYCVGLYTLNGSTLSLDRSYVFNAQLSQNSVTAQSMRVWWGTDSAANSTSWGGNSSASMTGWREALMFTGTSTLSNGLYYMAVVFTHRTSGASVGGINSAAFISGSQTTGGFRFGTSTGVPYIGRHIGSFSSSTTNTLTGFAFMPVSFNTSVLTSSGGSSQNRMPVIHLGTTG